MGKKRLGLTKGVKELRDHVDKWRRTRRRGVRMPEALWVQAVALARESSVWSVCHHLGLKFESLRRRVEGTGASSVALVPCKPAPTGFVELSGASILRMPSAGSVIEVVDGTGARLTIRLALGDRCDVPGIIQGFRARA